MQYVLAFTENQLTELVFRYIAKKKTKILEPWKQKIKSTDLIFPKFLVLKLFMVRSSAFH